MTAPAAPVIRARQDGINIYVLWQPVPTATDYNLYVSEAGGAFGIQAQFDDTEVDANGWFFTVEGPFVGPISIKATALNVLAEESAYSNTKQLNLSGGSTQSPTEAVRHARHI